MKNSLFAIWLVLVSSLLSAQSLPNGTTTTTQTAGDTSTQAANDAFVANALAAANAIAYSRQTYVAEDYCPGGNNTSGTCDYAVAYENFATFLGSAVNTGFYDLVSTQSGTKCFNTTMRLRHSIRFVAGPGIWKDCVTNPVWDSTPITVTGASMTLQGVGAASSFLVTVPNTAVLPAISSNYGVLVGGPGMRSNNWAVSYPDSTHVQVAQAPHVDLFGKTTLNSNVISAVSDMSQIQVGDTVNFTSGFGSTVQTVSSIDPTTNTFQVQVGGVNSSATISGDTSMVVSGTLTNVTLTFQEASPMIRIGMEAGALTGVQDEFGFLWRAGISGFHFSNTMLHPGMIPVQACNGDNTYLDDLVIDATPTTAVLVGGFGCASTTANGNGAITIREFNWSHWWIRNCGNMATGQSCLAFVNPYTTVTSDDRINTGNLNDARINSTFGPANIYVGSGWDQASASASRPGQLTFNGVQAESGNYHYNPTDGSAPWNAKARLLWESEGQTINWSGGFLNGVGMLEPAMEFDDVTGAFNITNVSSPPKGGIQLITANLNVTNGSPSFTCSPACMNTLTMGPDTLVAVGTGGTPQYLYLAGVPTSPTSGTFASNYTGTSGSVASEFVAGGYAYGTTSLLYGKNHTISAVGIGLSSLPDTFFQNGTGVKGDDFINTTGSVYSIFTTATGTPFGSRIGAGPNVCVTTITTTGPTTGFGGAGPKMNCNNYQQTLNTSVQDNNSVYTIPAFASGVMGTTNGVGGGVGSNIYADPLSGNYFINTHAFSTNGWAAWLAGPQDGSQCAYGAPSSGSGVLTVSGSTLASSGRQLLCLFSNVINSNVPLTITSTNNHVMTTGVGLPRSTYQDILDFGGRFWHAWDGTNSVIGSGIGEGFVLCPNTAAQTIATYIAYDCPNGVFVDESGDVGSGGATNTSGPTDALNGKWYGTPAGLLTATTFGTKTVCAAVGTSASPSAVSCGSAAAGHFSCAVTASGGSCNVSESGVTANSTITVLPVSATSIGTLLGVTCNTTPTTPPAIRLIGQTAGSGFTVALDTITTNPECFQYDVKN